MSLAPFPDLVAHMNNRTVLVDGNNLLHRAHHVFVKDRVPPMTSPDGYPTGLVYGALSMLSDWLCAIARPTKIVYFQDGAPTRRRALDPEYRRREEGHFEAGKGTSVKLVDGHEASCESLVLAHIMTLLGVDVYGHPDEEADDLIASYVVKHEGIHVIVSSDRDFYQLLTDDRVILYRPGVDGDRFFDSEKATDDMMRKHKVHVPPANIKMFKALTGDPSDNIKGIPHLRKKVAAPLCSFSSVSELFASGLPGFSKLERQRADELRSRLETNLDLVRIRTDVPLNPVPGTLNLDQARSVLQSLGIHGIDISPFHGRDPGTMRTSVALDDFYSEFLN